MASYGRPSLPLPALKPLKPLKTVKTLKTLTTRHGGPSLPFAMLHPASNRHPKATHQWLLMGVPYNPSWGSKPAVCHASSCSQQAPQGHTSMASYGRPSLWGSKPAVCHASSCSQQAPQGHTSMASYGRPSLPFASP